MPAKWCADDYDCPIAKTKLPSLRFHYLFTLLRLQRSGYMISNNALSLDDWQDLGELREAADSHKELTHLNRLGQQMAATLQVQRVVRGT